MRFAILSVLVAFGLFAANVGTVSAGNPHDPLPATLAISPASPSAFTVGTLSGCGYIANENVRMTQLSAQGTGWFGIQADASGCINGENWNDAAGSVTINAEQIVCNNGGRCTYKLMATLAYVIQ